MSTRLYARHGQPPQVRPVRRDPFNPFAFLAVIVALIAATGWAVGTVTW